MFLLNHESITATVRILGIRKDRGFVGYEIFMMMAMKFLGCNAM
jgi:hypothetical protein